MLTNTNKKIKSGAVSRADIYAVIKANNLQEECIKKFGKNFTVCKTTDLISLIKETEKKVPSASISKTENSTEVETPNEFVDIKARTAISILTEMLYADDYIDSDEKDEILNTLGNKTEATSPFENYKSSSASPYSDDEISNMFGFVE